MAELEKLIRILAIIAGAITLAVSTLSALLWSRQTKGRSSGKGLPLRSGAGVFLSTIGFVTLGVLLWKPLPINGSKEFSLLVTISGAIFFFCGVCLYLWGLGTMRSQFGVSNLFGAGLYKEHKLVTGGPFALVRHPLYVGVLLAAVGALLVFKTWAMVIFAPMSLVAIGRAKREETLLEQEFGEEWMVYTSNVPKWFPKLN
jgi:protein-S-isoprenylcysteine O-methyltransferase Ste14